MTKEWIKDTFNCEKPVIGMLHLLAMPTDPKYKKEGGVEAVLERARKDLHALQDGGIDAIIFCNEFSIPYIDNVRTVTVATMAYIIGELKKEITVPYGVHVAQDPYKTFDLAAAVGAKFVRETFFGAYVGDYGLTDIHVGELERHRYDVGCENARTLATFIPEGGMPLDHRPVEQMVKSINHNWHPDGLLVYGVAAGNAIDNNMLAKIESSCDTPVFASNGVNEDTVVDTLKICDGCIVATSLKVDGKFYNETDVNRVKRLMDKAKAYREGL